MSRFSTRAPPVSFFSLTLRALLSLCGLAFDVGRRTGGEMVDGIHGEEAGLSDSIRMKFFFSFSLW